MKFRLFFGTVLLFLASITQAQIIQFSGAPPAGSGQTFIPTSGLTEVWGTSKEAASCTNLFVVTRVDNSVTTTIPCGTDAAVASALTTALSSPTTTGVATTVYGQLGTGADLTATLSTGPFVFVDTDGKVSFGNHAGLGQTRKLTTTSTVVKVTNPHTFFVSAPGWPDNDWLDCCAGWGQDFYAYTGTTMAAARWGFNIFPGDTFSMTVKQNGADGFSSQNVLTQAYVGEYHVWDTSHSTTETRFDATTTFNSAQANVNITYPSTQTLVVGGTVTNGTPMGGRWRVFALYGATQNSTTRNSITNTLIANHGVVALPTSKTADGFTWTPQYAATGYQQQGPDAWSLYYDFEAGMYPWSIWFASNVNNGVDFTRYEARKWDTDTIVNGSPRSERSRWKINNDLTAISTTNRTLDHYFDFKVTGGPMASTVGWADVNQVHTFTGTSTPTFYYLSILQSKFTFEYQYNDAACSPEGYCTQIAGQMAGTYTTDTWYSSRCLIFWSGNQGTDRMQCWIGLHGSTLTKVVDLGPGKLFATDANAEGGGYVKEGLYSGGPGDPDNADTAVYIANHQWANSDTYSSRITSQPALPTHPRRRPTDRRVTMRRRQPRKMAA